MRQPARQLMLAASLLAMGGCSIFQGRDECIDRALTDFCQGAVNWATMPDIGSGRRALEDPQPAG